MKIQIKRSRGRGGHLRWRTVHANGRIGVWSESYHNRADLEASIEAHRRDLPTAPIEELKR